MTCVHTDWKVCERSNVRLLMGERNYFSEYILLQLNMISEMISMKLNNLFPKFSKCNFLKRIRYM